MAKKSLKFHTQWENYQNIEMTDSGNPSSALFRRRLIFEFVCSSSIKLTWVSGIKSVRVVIFSLNFPLKYIYWLWNYLRLGTKECMLLRLRFRRESKQARLWHKDELLCQVTKFNFHVFRRFVGPGLYAKSIAVTRDCDNFDRLHWKTTSFVLAAGIVSRFTNLR